MIAKEWNAQDYLNKAKEYAAQNKIDEALYCYNEAISLNPKLTQAYQARAELLLKDGVYKTALEDYDYLASLPGNEDKFYKERAICNEKLGNLERCLEMYTKLLLMEISPEAYYNIYRIVQEHPEFRMHVDLNELSVFRDNYIDEQRALKFKEAASENDLDQKSAFLDLYVTLLPKDSKYLYDAYLCKAQAEIFRYRLCFDKNFREELKQKENLTESELNKKYRYNSKNLSELNLIYAIQKFNEATRYATSLDEVNFLDNEVKKIISLAD